MTLRPRRDEVIETRAERRARMLLGLPEPALIARHKNVVDHWFENGCLSKRQALIAAGYAAGTPTSIIFSRPDVAAEIARRRAAFATKTDIDDEWVIERFRRIADADLGDLLEVQEDGTAWVDMSAMTPDQKSALSEYDSITSYGQPDEDGNPAPKVVKAKVRFHDKMAALMALARIRGMLKDKLEVSVGLTLGDKVQQARQRLAEQKTITQEGDPA